MPKEVSQKKIYHANANPKKTEWLINIRHSRLYIKKNYQDLRETLHYNKSVNLQEDVKKSNMYAPNIRTSKYLKSKLIELKEKIDKSSIYLENSTFLSQ